MKWWQIWKRDDDLQRELQSDMELKEEEQNSGRAVCQRKTRDMRPRRALGNRTLIKEQAHKVWGWAPFDRLWQDKL